MTERAAAPHPRGTPRGQSAANKLGNVANRLLFENERVRVWQMDLAPGEASDFHEHTLPYVLCILEGESIDADLEDGRTLHIPVEPGRVFFGPSGGRETASRPRPRARAGWRWALLAELG